MGSLEAGEPSHLERIPVTEEIERVGDDWRTNAGHCRRYAYAASRTHPGERVNDIACGIGYGSTFFDLDVRYVGYDRPGIPTFDGTFIGCDLNDPTWVPADCDVTVCFETLEHVEDPAALAWKIDATTSRAVFVSVPTEPTKDRNPFHLHDFTVDDIPALFPAFTVVDLWAQPEECSHVWHLER